MASSSFSTFERGRAAGAGGILLTMNPSAAPTCTCEEAERTIARLNDPAFHAARGEAAERAARAAYDVDDAKLAAGGWPPDRVKLVAIFEANGWPRYEAVLAAAARLPQVSYYARTGDSLRLAFMQRALSQMPLPGGVVLPGKDAAQDAAAVNLSALGSPPDAVARLTGIPLATAVHYSKQQWIG